MRVASTPDCAAAMVAKVGGVFGTLRYPHLILPYLPYYGHLASIAGWGSLHGVPLMPLVVH
jgi:hypothetical protein